MLFRSSSLNALLLLASFALVACGGPRSKILDEGKYRARPRTYPIDIYVGKVLESHREIAIIDSTGYPTDNEASRKKEIEELKRKARAMGGDAIHDVRLLTKEVKGYTIDERVPFPSWKQGDYPLYFMRGVVITYESGMPGAVASGKGFTDGPTGYIPPGITSAKMTDTDQITLDDDSDESDSSEEGEFVPVREDNTKNAPAVEIPNPPADPKY